MLGNSQLQNGKDQAITFSPSFVSYFQFSAYVDPINNPMPISVPTEQEMYEIIMLAKDNDPTYKRTTFIVTPSVSDIPPGCESISDTYILQVNAIVEEMGLVNDFASYALDPTYPIA